MREIPRPAENRRDFGMTGLAQENDAPVAKRLAFISPACKCWEDRIG